MNSTELIQRAKDEFKALEHKGYEWKSFYNGFLIAYGVAVVEFKNCNLPIVTNCAFPEWLDSETRAKAKEAWDSHKNTDDNLRVKAIKIIQKRAKDAGYEIRISTAIELFKKHCL